MSQQTKIEWCDSTINFWSGCTKVSAGCTHCYAETMDKRHLIEKVSHWGKGAPRLKSKSAVKLALSLNRQPWICDACGMAHANPGQICMTPGCDCKTRHRRRIFSLSRGDWLDNDVPIEWLAEMLATIRECDQVIWILCTKRPELFNQRMDALMAWMKTPHGSVEAYLFVDGWRRGYSIPSNVLLLASVEDQPAADRRIPQILRIPARWHGLSCEPLLGPVELEALRLRECGFDGLDWIIVGGESGLGARPCQLEWVESLVDQCRNAKVPVFVKQLGANATRIHDKRFCPACDGKPYSLGLYHPKGGDILEWPAAVSVRQFFQQ